MESTPFTGYDAPIRQSLIYDRLLMGVPFFVGLVLSTVTFLAIWQLSWPGAFLWRVLLYGSLWGMTMGGLAWFTSREPQWLELWWRRLFEPDSLE